MQEPDAVRAPIACVAVFIIFPLLMYSIPQSVMRTFTSEHVIYSRGRTESRRISVDSAFTLTDRIENELQTETL